MFRDRTEAGMKLAEKLSIYKDDRPVILALPRGGVPIAEIVAQHLGVPVHALVVKKVGFPDQPELAAGAICEDGPVYWNEDVLRYTGFKKEDFKETVEDCREKVDEYQRYFRKGLTLPALTDRIAIIIDDGLATGSTARAAICHIKEQGALKVILAVPVGAPDSVEALSADADEVIALELPSPFRAVGLWYENFEPVSEEEVFAALHSPPSPAHP